MSDTIKGYHNAAPYPAHLAQEFTPPWIDFALNQAGWTAPRQPRAPFQYADLGCGSGLALVLMAAAHPEGTFLGTDAAAAPLADAAALAAELGLANVAFRAQTFEQTLADPPQGFDYVAAFGVLAWVDSANRMRVLDLARRMLRPGGALVLAYNALPGWSPDLIAQRLLHGWYRRAEGAPKARFAVAVRRLSEAAAAGARGLDGARVAALADWFRIGHFGFFAHEWLQDHWTPLAAADVLEPAARCGLHFAASLRAVDNRLDFLLTAGQRRLVAGEPDPVLQQTLINSLIDRWFRTDVLLADPQAAAPEALRRRRLQQWLAAARDPAEAVFATPTPAGRLGFDNRAARAIVHALADGPVPLDRLSATGTAGIGADLLNATDALVASSQVIPVDPPVASPRAAPNHWLLAPGHAETAPAALVGRNGAIHVGEARMAALRRGTPAPMDLAALTRLGIPVPGSPGGM